MVGTCERFGCCNLVVQVTIPYSFCSISCKTRQSRLNDREGVNRRAAVHNRRRRARKAFAVPQRWVRRLDHDDELCYWCGSVDVEHVDHVHPISLGGPAVPSNEVPSCVPCNMRKHNKRPLVWISELMERT